MDENMDIDFIRNRINTLRLNSGLSERELSLNLGYHPDYINKILSGKMKPSLDAFLNMCDYFKLSPYEFFYIEGSEILQSKKFYDELKRLGGKNLDEFLLLLETMTPRDFEGLTSLLWRYRRLDK